MVHEANSRCEQQVIFENFKNMSFQFFVEYTANLMDSVSCSCQTLIRACILGLPA